MDISKYLEISVTKRFGKPVIKGTRIAVYDILNWLANGMTNEEILHDFPELKKEYIQAALLFAASRDSHLGIA